MTISQTPHRARNMAGIAARALICAGLMVMAVACEDQAPEIIIPTPVPPEPAPVPMVSNVSLTSLSVIETGIFNGGAAEDVAFDPGTDQLFIINSSAITIDVVDLSQPDTPAQVMQIDASTLGGRANSIDVANGRLAVAIEANNPQDPGLVAFYNIDNLSSGPSAMVTVGAMPDMVTFTPGGATLLVANEGEPNDAYTVDPEGSVSIINVANAVPGESTLTSEQIIRTANFNGFDDQLESLRTDGVRIFGPNASVSQDLEPEFITIATPTTAVVSLQENNAIAILNFTTAEFSTPLPLGMKNHSLGGNGFDASDLDTAINNGDVPDGINITPRPTFGLYQPDAIASYIVGGMIFIVTANEGDTRNYSGFSEEARVSDLTLDLSTFTNAATLQGNDSLGRLSTTTVNSDINENGDVETILSIGARSFSIFDFNGNLVSDSGDDFETIIAERLPASFNSDNTANTFDTRSDEKGPEPEGLVLAQFEQQVFAFIGLERVGGIMIYDISDPAAPVFQDYVNIRDFTANPQNPDGSTNSTAGDLGPEKLEFVSAADSPLDVPLLIVGNETSGSTRVFEITFTVTDGT